MPKARLEVEAAKQKALDLSARLAQLQAATQAGRSEGFPQMFILIIMIS